ncbi:hypothetical protein CPter91_4251 [Collimonas pratensis]|uniref:Uncharacterized protein n=1 Tax=Collimonas pratensis TaxID=279113 RepID=A0A127Q989_9BURK|nr:hypothetical protein CPter91_4251 [Collimonas pratensis]
MLREIACQILRQVFGTPISAILKELNTPYCFGNDPKIEIKSQSVDPQKLVRIPL